MVDDFNSEGGASMKKYTSIPTAVSTALHQNGANNKNDAKNNKFIWLI